MKIKFECIYFDGVSSKANNVELLLEKYGWRISFLDNSRKDILWHLDKIQKPEVYTSGFYSYTYGAIPREILEIADGNLEKSLNLLYPTEDLTRKGDAYLINNSFKTIILALFLFIGLALFSYFIIIPNSSVLIVNNLKPKTIEKIGDALFSNMEESLDIDEGLTLLMQEFAEEIDHDGPFKMKVRVSNHEMVNAFAMPGGNIVIYRALLEQIENENQLLSLLGHEYTHTTERHVLKSLVKSLSGSILITLFVGDANGLLAFVLENAHVLNQLSFSRELEKEADIKGIELVEKNNADPNGLHELFSIMNSEIKTGDIDFLATHPNMNERIEYIKKITEDKEIETNFTLREKWMKIKDKMFE